MNDSFGYTRHGSGLQMLMLAHPHVAAPFPSDQTLFLRAISVPDQPHEKDSWFRIVVGDQMVFWWSVEDAIARYQRTLVARPLLADLYEKVRLQLRNEPIPARIADELRELALYAETLQLAHMIRFDPTILVAPRQDVHIDVVKRRPRPSDRSCSPFELQGAPVEMPLKFHVACSWTRDIA
jgi:hypothetical protein